jgi:hypothetical protein
VNEAPGRKLTPAMLPPGSSRVLHLVAEDAPGAAGNGSNTETYSGGETPWTAPGASLGATLAAPAP